MSKKKPLPPKKKNKAPAKPAAKKKPAAKVTKPVAKKSKPAPKKVTTAKAKTAKKAKPSPAKISKSAAPKRAAVKTKKPVSKPSKTKPAPKKAAPKKPSPKATAKPAKKAKVTAKPTKPAKKIAPAKAVKKTVTKPAKKPTVTAKPAKKAPPAPAKKAKAPVKAAKKVTAKKTPPPAIAKKPVAVTPPPSPVTTKKSGSKKTKVTGKPAATKTPSPRGGVPRETARKAKPVSREKTRPTIYFSIDEIREYLQQRKDAKIEPVVTSEKTGKTMTPAARKAAALAEAPVQKARNVGAVSVEDLLGFNPFKKEGAKFEESQIPPKWRKYYKLLVELRDGLQAGLSLHTEDALKKSGKDDSGDLSGYSQHMADAGTDSFDRDFALSLVSSEQEALAEIAEAIDRMRTGKYGVCEITRKPIPADRLVAVPFTRYSLEGQRELERNRRNRRRGGVLGNPIADLGDGVNFGAAEESEEN